MTIIYHARSLIFPGAPSCHEKYSPAYDPLNYNKKYYTLTNNFYLQVFRSFRCQRRVAREGVDPPGCPMQRRVQRLVQRRREAPVAARHGAVERFDTAAAQGHEVLVVGAPWC